MAKKATKKPAKKASKKPSKARTAAKRGKATPRPKKIPKRAVRPRRQVVKVASGPPVPEILAQGSVGLSPGRLRWHCTKAAKGVVVSFEPSGVRALPGRISLTLKCKGEPEAVWAQVGEQDMMPKVDGNQVDLQFVPLSGWQEGIRIGLEGIEAAPEVS